MSVVTQCAHRVEYTETERKLGFLCPFNHDGFNARETEIQKFHNIIQITSHTRTHARTHTHTHTLESITKCDETLQFHLATTAVEETNSNNTGIVYETEETWTNTEGTAYSRVFDTGPRNVSISPRVHPLAVSLLGLNLTGHCVVTIAMNVTYWTLRCDKRHERHSRDAAL